MIKKNNNSILTLTELVILDLMAEGANNEKIAEFLSISTNTVKTHIQKIYKKMNVKKRIDAILVYLGVKK